MKSAKHFVFKSCLMFISVTAFTFLSSCGSQTGSGEEEETTEDATQTAASSPEDYVMNGLTEAEAADGWILMFDGKTATGWRGYGKDHFPAGWEITDGTIKMNGSGRGEAGAKDGGDIIYDREFENFDWKLEWKISEGGNSGIFYLGQEKPELGPIWKTAPEMQVLDNERHPDAQLGKNGNRQAGALYDLIPAVPQNAKPAGEWNQVEIIVYNGTVIHKQNGEVVVEYHLWTDEWNDLVAGSKFPALNPDWANVASKGYLGLQDHGDDVWYRNLKIKPL
jgi:alpha-3'-ketoglucosidase